MNDEQRRTARAILRTAVLWGGAWAVAGGGLIALLTVFSPGPGVASAAGRLGMAALAGIGWGLRFGLAGFVIGSIFSSVIRLGYRGKRLAEINPVRFALLGAVVGGVGVPLYLQTMNVLSGGHPIAWGLVTDDAVWATVFGAAVAAGSILLARRADTLPAGPRQEELAPGGPPGAATPAVRSEATVPRHPGPAGS